MAILILRLLTAARAYEEGGGLTKATVVADGVTVEDERTVEAEEEEV